MFYISKTRVKSFNEQKSVTPSVLLNRSALVKKNWDLTKIKKTENYKNVSFKLLRLKKLNDCNSSEEEMQHRKLTSKILKKILKHFVIKHLFLWYNTHN